jgi:hypothetical protein
VPPTTSPVTPVITPKATPQIAPSASPEIKPAALPTIAPEPSASYVSQDYRFTIPDGWKMDDSSDIFLRSGQVALFKIE